MSIKAPVKVPEQRIDSVKVPGFTDGWDLNGPHVASPSSFVDSKDIQLNISGQITPRNTLSLFLPNTESTVYQVLPVLYNGTLYYFTVDGTEVKFCQEGDSSWTACSGTNAFSTGSGKPHLLRALNQVLILNGLNGDKIATVDLTTGGFPVTKPTAITDPTTALTDSLTNLTAGAFNMYYAYSYTNDFGETEISTIATISINITRDQWATQSSKGSITLTRPSAPAGAKFWNLYAAVAATGGSIQPSDMLQLAVKLDLNTVNFTDDGTLSMNLGQVAPIDNSTGGFKATYGIIVDSTVICFGDPDNPENIYISGGGAVNGLNFSLAGGGYLAQPDSGTNFSVAAIIGFRNGAGAPSLTVLFSNTEGLAKQSVLEQDTVTYGSITFTVWGVKEQHYGAAGVAATDSVTNYNGKLVFLSTDGFMQMNTQPLRQNVISTDPISVQRIDSYARAIKNAAMNTVVGTAWDNKYVWIVPPYGFDTPQDVLISDENHKGAWYRWSIPGQWIGVVTPANEQAFVYICQGNRIFKMLPGGATFDVVDGVPVPFSTSATGSFIPLGSSPNREDWQALVQAKFYVLGLVGDMTIGVTYKDQSGVPKTKTKVLHGPSFVPGSGGSWGDPEYNYGNFPMIPDYADSAQISGGDVEVQGQDFRESINVDDIASEAQWFFSTPAGYSKYTFLPPVYEGVGLGVKPDLQ